MHISFLTLSALGAFAFAADLQDPGGAPGTEPLAVEIDAKAAALEAMRTVDSTAFHFAGSVAIEKAEKGGGALGGVQFIVAGDAGGIPGMGGASKAFEGNFIGYRYHGGEDIIICSESRLPGFRAWFGSQQIVETLNGKESLRVQSVMDEASALLDFGALERHAKKAEWSATHLKDGSMRLSAELSGKALSKAGNPRMPFSFGAKVLRVEAELVVDQEAWLTSATYRIVHNDPMAAMQEIVAAGGAGGAVNIRFDSDEEETDPVDGEVTIWELTFAERAPSKVVAEFREEMSGLLDAEDF